MHNNNLSNLSNESRILLLCSQLNIDEENKKILKDILNKDINWQKVLKYACFHRTVCLLYKNLSQMDFNRKEIINTWQGYYQYFLDFNQLTQEKLSFLLNDLKRKNIKIIIRKGMELIKLVYKDMGLRPTGDIDVLVRPEDWKEINNTLRNMGLTSELDLLKLHNLSQGRLCFHILYLDKTPGKVNNPYSLGYVKYIRVEPRIKLHHFDFYKSAIDEIWKDALVFSSEGMDALMLSHEDTIMDLCFNLSKYQFSRLLCVCDINEFILKYKDCINWDLFTKKSQARYLNPINYSGLRCAKRLFNTPFPDDLLKDLEPPRYTIILLNKLYPKINSVEESLGEYLSYIPNELRFFMMTYRLTNINMLIKILAFFFKTIFPSVKFLSYRYDIPRTPFIILFCYLKRFKKALRLLGKFLINVVARTARLA